VASLHALLLRASLLIEHQVQASWVRIRCRGHCFDATDGAVHVAERVAHGICGSCRLSGRRRGRWYNDQACDDESWWRHDLQYRLSGLMTAGD